MILEIKGLIAKHLHLLMFISWKSIFKGISNPFCYLTIILVYTTINEKLNVLVV